jgi:peptidoglycan hydrolase-like protein with peptidoglycan-binding domain
MAASISRVPKRTRLIVSGVLAAGLAITVIAGASVLDVGASPVHAKLAVRAASSATVDLNACPLLRMGTDNQDCVKQLQDDLNAAEQANLSVDGIFGSSTKDAVIAFQQKSNLPGDGVAGPQTKAALLGSLGQGPAPAPATQPSAPPTGPSDPLPGPVAPPHATVGPLIWPAPGITHTSGLHTCGIGVPQFAASYFYGPIVNQEPDGSYTVRAEVETAIANGGCGVSATYNLQTEVCKKYAFYTSCHWTNVATLKYDDLPINGRRVSDQLIAPLRNGSNSYRIEATVDNLKNLDAEADPAPGIIGISSDGIYQRSQTAVLQSP